MTVVQQVQAAKSPREALLILAGEIDALRARPPAASLDSWEAWGDGGSVHVDAEPDPVPAGPPVSVSGDEAPQSMSTDEAGGLVEIIQNSLDSGNARADISDDDVRMWIGRNYGRTPSDDDEGRALIAMVRSDLERAGRGEVRSDDFVMDEGIVQSRIDWAPHDEKHRAMRYSFAKNILQLEVALGPHPAGGDWAADYASGGPMWLYIGNWDLIKQYPDNVKAAMVADVEVYDKRVAYEMGADLLKQPMTKDEHSPAGNLSLMADD